MSPIRTAVAFLAVLLIFSCKGNAGQSDQAGATSQPALPSLSREDIADLHTRTEKTDVVFFNLPVSVSQDDAASAKFTVTYIAPVPPPAGAQCPAVARLSWISGGAIIQEANIHIDDTCAYLVFMENEQPVASNAMEKNGQDFFRSIMQQAKQQMEK